MVQKDELSCLVKEVQDLTPRDSALLIWGSGMWCSISQKHHYIVLKQVVHGQYFEKYYLKPKA